MTFQSEFKGNQKLCACALADKEHVGESSASTGPHVVLIKRALNAWSARQKPSLPPLQETQNFDSLTGDRVERYKRSFTPQILNYKGVIDRIVGIKTVALLDRELPPAGSAEPPVNAIAPTDLIIYISGKADRIDKGGTRLAKGESAEFDQLLNLPARAGSNLITLGFGGSLENNDALKKVLPMVTDHNRNFNSIILYGYSAGAKQLLDLCRQVEGQNAPPNFAFLTKRFLKIDLLITIDAASGLSSFSIDRNVAGCVRKNINFFQTSLSLMGSRGAPNGASPGHEGIFPKVDNRSMDARLATVTATTRHGEINGVAHPLAVNEITQHMRQSQ
jgi:hypothetical protein